MNKKQLCYIHMLNYYLGTTIDKCSNTDEYQKSIMPNERSQIHKNTHCMTTLYANLEKSKLLTTESRSVVARLWGWEIIKGNKRIF